jgi:hypothetical protein
MSTNFCETSFIFYKLNMATVRNMRKGVEEGRMTKLYEIC